jgi:UvrD/REP helicase N-terminal domain/Sel1 repeat
MTTPIRSQKLSKEKMLMNPTIEPAAPSKSLSELITNAEAGDPNSQYELAQLYDLGQGIPRNLVQAVQWYQQAADQGNMLAALQLGVSPSIQEIKAKTSTGEVTKIYGPPGTGKTTTLIDLVTKAIAVGTLPNQIGYFSYTNQATEEAKNRILRKFPKYDEAKDFPYFQTLHSLAYRSLRTKVKLLTEEQALDFDKEVEVDPISRTPYCSYRRSPRCPIPNRLTRRNFESKWSSWFELAANLASWPKSLAVTPPAS